MAHQRRTGGAGGLSHLLLGMVIVAGVALYAQTGGHLSMLTSLPRIAALIGERDAACAERAADLGLAGRIGCGGIRGAARLARLTTGGTAGAGAAG